jgi:transcription termination factor 2
VTSLHNSIKTYPDKGATTNAPSSLRVSLMPHQKSALAWLLWRETQTPPGGILADDMGLGKTVMMIAHVLKSKEEEVKAKRGAASTGGTLVVCPASVMNQWEAEVKQTTDGSLSVNVHHGPRRETNAKRYNRSLLCEFFVKEYRQPVPVRLGLDHLRHRPQREQQERRRHRS